LDQPPHHPYTGLLVDSVPALKRGWLDAHRNVVASALPPLSVDSGSGELCSFRSRCSARLDGKCNAVAPPLRTLPSGAQILCHRSADELKQLQPIRGAA
jgi:peptide/nickel transport system ATP-binding protein